MTFGGWIVMIISVGAVTILFGWCIYKVLTAPNECDNVHGFELDTPDRHEDV
jgi:hypothetical protein